MWRTEPIAMDQNRNKPIQSESSSLSKPQIFVQLAFGVSWSQRHTPQTHTITYMSRHLKNARESGNFPRQVPPPNTNYLVLPEARQQRSREHPSRHHQQRQSHRQHHHAHPPAHAREPGYPRNQGGNAPSEQVRARPRRSSASDTRGMLYERGRSAPPPFNDSPWDVPYTSASLFPPRAQRNEEATETFQALPPLPSQYRLGEDGLPWSAWAWPWGIEDEDEDEDEDDALPYANNPTTIPLVTDQPRSEDPERVRELESLSTAMMTVDNGFENQWWYQGPRESMERWWTRRAAEAEDARTTTTAEAVLLSDIEPPSALEPGEEQVLSFSDIVSPISDASGPTQSFNRPLFRSLTTRSEELWMGS